MLRITQIAPGVEADADDTAMSILLLNILGKSFPAKDMIKAFGNESHFITYPRESNASFSANCNVLLCLLASPDLESHIPQVEKVARFLFTCWYESNDPIKDKWVSEFY